MIHNLFCVKILRGNSGLTPWSIASHGKPQFTSTMCISNVVQTSSIQKEILFLSPNILRVQFRVL